MKQDSSTRADVDVVQFTVALLLLVAIWHFMPEFIPLSVMVVLFAIVGITVAVFSGLYQLAGLIPGVGD